ncbi:MAG: carboxypeptidase-like regulatory domain-containing protein [Planctomycetota bacterium]
MPIDVRIRNIVATLCVSTACAAQALSGILVDPAGAPVAGAVVTLNPGALSGVSAGNGTFSIPVPRGRVYDVLIAPGQTTLVAQALEIAVAPTGTTTAGTIPLRAGVTVLSQVLDPAGAPIAGATMQAFSQGGQRIPTPGNVSGANGAVAIVVPSAEPVQLRWLTATGPLVPVTRDFVSAVPASLGAVVLPLGHALQGTVAAAATGVPIAGCELIARDVQTGAIVPQRMALTAITGGFDLLVPTGLYDLELLPPPSARAAAHRLRSVLVLGASTSLGTVPLQQAVAVSGRVRGPNGDVAGARIEARTASGYDVFLSDVRTDATGAFAVMLPPGAYELRLAPPVATGLAGRRLAPLALGTDTQLGDLVLGPGVPITLDVRTAAGPVADARLELTDPATGVTAVIPGAVADAAGRIEAIAPAGTWDARIAAPQGSAAAALAIPSAPIQAPVQGVVTLAAKALVTDLVTIVRGAVAPIANGGLLPIEWTCRNPGPFARAVLLDAVVEVPNGASVPVVPPLPLVVPAGFVGGLSTVLPMPALTGGALGREHRFTVRLLDPSTLLTLESASVSFLPQ